MENNALVAILKRNGFFALTDYCFVRKDGFKFVYKNDYEYSLTFDINKFGFVHQILIVWLKYEECIEQLETAIKTIEIQYETNTNL